MDGKQSRVAAQCVPLTSDRWSDLERLFGPRGAQAGCWCMWWHQTAKAFAASKGEANRRAFRAIVDAGEEPGLLALVEDQPVGWCAVAPRECYARLVTSRTLKPIDQRPVWSVTCFFIDRRFRGRGLTIELLRAAVDFVGRRGGKLVEGYPIVPPDDRYPSAYAYTGLASAFVAAGFTEVARPSPTRAIMRREVDARHR